MPVPGYRTPNPQMQMMAARIAAVQYTQAMNSHWQRAPRMSQAARQELNNSQGSATQSTSEIEQRRAAEKERRQTVRQQLPQPIQDNEQQAASKYELAHMLWQNGNAPAARQWLGDIIDKFPATQTADRARQALAHL